MTGRMIKKILGTTAIGAIGALALGAAAQAQPGYYAPDDTYTAGNLVVHAPRYQGRTWSGAPIVSVRTSRRVDFSDLDLSTGWGVHELHNRVERAAADACNELTNNYTMGLYSIDDPTNTDCINYAVEDAMAQAPITYVNYDRYDDRNDRYDRRNGY